ncbi:MAG TPA: type II CAAX endopeptidase family protein [Polyangia bacterium]|nr:type II CAAX endopeptidase family protein [Polyangia bacterium]
MGRGGSPRAAIGVAIALMGIAALENTVAPWAPFYFVYAALTVALPFALGAVTVGRIPIPRLRFWIAAVVIAVLGQLVFRALVAAADLPGMFAPVFATAGARLNRSPGAVAQAYLLFIIVWAALGEELFYRGYLQARLRRHFGATAAITVAAVLFAVRHYVQVLLAWPHIFWGSATIWVGGAFMVGLALGWLYERSGSLLPPIAAHYLFNLLG